MAWIKALDAHDGAKACSLLTPGSIRTVESAPPRLPGLPRGGPAATAPIHRRRSEPCPKVLSDASGPAPPIVSTDIHGGRAVVTMEDGSQLLHSPDARFRR